jgi:hypothetical protein
VSGGGGWGVKKGLLSLDPQKSHFALSEEEEMQSFFQGDGDSSFAAPGSEVQFFASLPSQQSKVDEKLQGFVFGVSASEEDSLATPDSEAADLVVRTNQFGALSNTAVYVSSKKQKESKLSVPGSRVCLGSDLEGNGNGMFRNFGADVATLGLLGALNL